jgi:glutamate-1-semialdehyde 2,1-aminomutase
VRKLRRVDAPAHLARIGRKVEGGWRELGRKHRVPVTTPGRPELALIGFDHPEAAALTTLMTARMLKHGFLAGAGFVATLAHQDRHVEAYLAVLDEVFAEMAAAIRDGDIARRIGGPVKHSAFARLT